MVANLNSITVLIIASVILLNVSPCTCSKNMCGGPAGVTRGIFFRLTDSNGRDILSANAAVTPVPDSIKLRDAHSNFFYPLFISRDNMGVIVFSNLYNRPANIVDSLIFTFGSTRPDTLIIHTALISTHRGDRLSNSTKSGHQRRFHKSPAIVLYGS